MNVFTRARPGLRQANVALRCRYASAAAPSPSSPATPPLLLKIREDLKTAMRAKDAARLNVLRGLLAEVTNAAKTSSPIDSDMKVLSMLRKRSSAAASAAKEFEGAGRQDLKDKEDAAITILDAYAGEVETVGEQEIVNIVTQAIKVLEGENKKFNQGDVMKQLLGPGGAFEGKNVEKSSVARAVKQALTK